MHSPLHLTELVVPGGYVHLGCPEGSRGGKIFFPTSWAQAESEGHLPSHVLSIWEGEAASAEFYSHVWFQ